MKASHRLILALWIVLVGTTTVWATGIDVRGGASGSGTVTSVSGTAPIVVATGTTTPAISCTGAGAGTSGCLTASGAVMALDAGLTLMTGAPLALGPNGGSSDAGFRFTSGTTSNAIQLAILDGGADYTIGFQQQTGGSAGVVQLTGASAGAVFQVKNTAVAGFPGIEYANAAGTVVVFTGYNNGNIGEFRFNNIASAAHIDFMIASAIKFAILNSGYVSAITGYSLNGNIMYTATAPSGPVACTSPTITHGTTASFQADVGSTCTGVSTFAFTVPSTTNGMRCTGDNTTAAATRILSQSGGWTGTTITMTNYSRTTGIASDFADGADLVIDCTGR